VADAPVYWLISFDIFFANRKDYGMIEKIIAWEAILCWTLFELPAQCPA